MKILLIGNLPEDGQQSMQRFTTLLHDGLTARGHDVTTLTPTLRVARLGPRYHYNGLPKYLGYFDKFALFPVQLWTHVRRTRPDIVHLTDQASAVYRSSLRSVRVLATCHDLLQIRAAGGEIPQHRLSGTARAHQEWIRRSLEQLPHVVCVSARTRAEVLRLTSLVPAQISVVPNALNYPYQAIAAATAHPRLDAFATGGPGGTNPLRGNPGGFVLHVGGEQWYKNRPGLLALYAELRAQLTPPPALVMVGPPLGADDAALVAKLNLTAHVTVLTGVSNAQLEALYVLAEALLFPSLEEGFGWPVAEAQTCGCPVFTSDREPMTEVGGRYATYFDPTDPAAAARLIAAAWPTRHAQREATILAASRWQLSTMIDAYEALYRRLRT